MNGNTLVLKNGVQMIAKANIRSFPQRRQVAKAKRSRELAEYQRALRSAATLLCDFAPLREIFSRFAGRGEIVVIGLLLSLCLGGCAVSSSDQPTPEQAKRFLKLRGYDFNEKSFLLAAASSDVTAVSGFLDAGISPDARDASDETALIAAASRGDMEIVKSLLRGGADVNANVRGGYTALLLALMNKRDDVADLLVAQPNLDVNARGTDGVTILMTYIWRRREDVVERLLQRGADVNLQEHDGDTALHAACNTGDLNVLRSLLAKGANPNLKNKLGGTPLMWAAVYGYQDAVQLLLDKGADPRLKDVDGVTAAQWADKNKRTEVAKVLREAEGRK